MMIEVGQSVVRHSKRSARDDAPLSWLEVVRLDSEHGRLRTTRDCSPPCGPNGVRVASVERSGPAAVTAITPGIA
jgi:hypothetical protein